MVVHSFLLLGNGTMVMKHLLRSLSVSICLVILAQYIMQVIYAFEVIILGCDGPQIFLGDVFPVWWWTHDNFLHEVRKNIIIKVKQMIAIYFIVKPEYILAYRYCWHCGFSFLLVVITLMTASPFSILHGEAHVHNDALR